MTTVNFEAKTITVVPSTLKLILLSFFHASWICSFFQFFYHHKTTRTHRSVQCCNSILSFCSYCNRPFCRFIPYILVQFRRRLSIWARRCLAIIYWTATQWRTEIFLKFYYSIQPQYKDENVLVNSLKFDQCFGCLSSCLLSPQY